jgi:hypothetical protein
MSPVTAGLLTTIGALTLALIGVAVLLLAARDKLSAVAAQAEADVERMAGETTYWRERCEQMTDAALIRAGAVPGPVYAEQKVGKPDPMARLFSGMAVNEIDSRRKTEG